MKALTVCQPYAEKIRNGEKVIENRTWPTTVRGRIAIHAGKSRSWLEDGDEAEYPDMAFGAIVATAELYDCKKWEELTFEQQQREDAGGPFCFMLRDVQPLATPIPINGAQGFWNFDESLLPAGGDHVG
jgi:hypothetical protein